MWGTEVFFKGSENCCVGEWDDFYWDALCELLECWERGRLVRGRKEEEGVTNVCTEDGDILAVVSNDDEASKSMNINSGDWMNARTF